MRTLPSLLPSSHRRTVVLAAAASALLLFGFAPRADAQSLADQGAIVAPAPESVAPPMSDSARSAPETANSANSANSTKIAAPLVRSTPAALTVRAQDRALAYESAPAPLPRQESQRSNTALMLVGAAAILVGALVDDDAGTVLIIGGAAVGLYGLYRFLN